MRVRRSPGLSRVLVVATTVLVFLSGVVGFLNSAVVDGQSFAKIVNSVRADGEVRTQIGRVAATAAVDAQPDLVAVEPAIAAGVSAVVGSPLLDPVFVPAIRSFHDALTEEDSDAAVLTLADLGATLTTALERFVPEAADVIPDGLTLTLAQIGGQGGVAARIIPIMSAVATLAWVLPLLTALVVVVAVAVAPRRRLAAVDIGWATVIGGGFLGLLALGLSLTGAAIEGSTLSGALLGASMTAFAQPLGIRFVATVVVGGVIVAAAGAFLPQVNVIAHVRSVVRALTTRPKSPVWATVRSILLILTGLLVVLFPAASARAVTALAGLGVLLFGITELDVLAERSRAADQRRAAKGSAREAGSEGPGGAGSSRSGYGWLVPVVALGVGVIVVLTALLPGHLPAGDSSAGAPTDPEACNGSVALCDRPFDEVVIPASHNSMSVADGTWFLPEQPKDMVASLDDGIRGLLVDTWYGQATESGGAVTADRSYADALDELRATYGDEVVASVRRTVDRVRREGAAGPVEPYFCHSVCEIGASRMLDVMKRLRSWLDAHPRDVIVLFIQDTVTPSDTAEVLRTAGVAELAMTHADGAPWPTLREMIEADQRVLVLMENRGGGAKYPWLHQGFDLVQDTEYTFGTAEDFTCTLKRGRPDSPLFSINHWLANFTHLISSAEEVNTKDVLEARIQQCRDVRGRAPTMIAVNWYDRGDLFEVVDELNGVG